MNDIFSGPWNRQRVVAMLHLAWAVIRRVWRRLTRGRRDDGGAERFLDNFASEGMVPLTAEQTTVLEGAGRCIQCGLCEATCPLPVDRWLAYSRALDMATHAAATTPPACPEGCRACEAICPTGVPLAAIPAFVHRQADALPPDASIPPVALPPEALTPG